MRTFYRIETMDMDEMRTRGGYMAAATALLCKKLGITPDHTEKELYDAVNSSDSRTVKSLMGELAYLCDIPIPEVYKENQNSLFCLYTREGFEEAYTALYGIDELLELNMPRFSLWCKKFDIEEREILYEDEFQIVIDSKTYEMHREEHEHEFLGDVIWDLEPIE